MKVRQSGFKSAKKTTGVIPLSNKKKPKNTCGKQEKSIKQEKKKGVFMT
jgi:hypothetical protein